jgi:hypothetical protein
VKTPTTPAAIHEPCQSESEISLTLDTFLGNPIPDTFLRSKEQPLSTNSDGSIAAAT